MIVRRLKLILRGRGERESRYFQRCRLPYNSELRKKVAERRSYRTEQLDGLSLLLLLLSGARNVVSALLHGTV